VKVEVARKGGVRKTIEVKLEAVKSQGNRTLTRANRSNDAENSNNVTSLGIQVTPLTTDLADQLGLPETMQGLVVTDVDPDGAVAGHLTSPDEGGPDVIESVEGQSVHTVKELRHALADHKAGDIVSLRVYNGRAKAGRVERVQLGGEDHE